jgi:hypothetical protein
MKRDRAGHVSHGDQTPPDYQCSVDGYYPARRSSTDHHPPLQPLFSPSDEDIREVKSPVGRSGLGYCTTAVHTSACMATPCLGALAGPGYGGGGGGMVRLQCQQQRPGPTQPPDLQMCVDCGGGGTGDYYEKRRTILTTGGGGGDSGPSSQAVNDQTMTRLTTTSMAAPAATGLCGGSTVAGRDRVRHVYEMPHAV